jgi:predicted lipoprotein with Yx(FWY)xxD motif
MHHKERTMVKIKDVHTRLSNRTRVATAIGVLVAVGLVVAACGGNKSSGYANSMASSPPGGAVAQPVTSKSTVSLSMNAKIGQQVLVDSSGMTLYLFVPDGTSPTSTVPVQFKPNWPPVTAMGAPTAGSGVDVSKLAVHPQSDGTQQVSYNGHLLYTFIMDKAPGDANGQGLGPNNWFVVDANGNAIGAPKPASRTMRTTPMTTARGW